MKLHYAPEQISSLLDSVPQPIHSTGLQKFLSTITAKIIVNLSKIAESIVIAFSAVELWHLSH